MNGARWPRTSSGEWILESALSMSIGLIALLDDIAALAKMAAASLDDAATQAVKASSKAAGIVIDDTAVTPRYVVGLAAARELPIIRQIALGSLKNKLLFLLPGFMALSLLAPKLITPLLMIGGAYLCYEGYHKVHELLHRKSSESESDAVLPEANPETLEAIRVASAVRTDFILSAEIMAITLGTVAALSLGMQAAILAVVGLVMTIGVYGVVALIVKADDAGVAMAQNGNGVVRALGRGLVHGMPGFLKVLTLVGMLAMLWVGGGIVTHGLHELGVHQPEEWIHAASGGVWLVQAAMSGVLGLAIGAVCAPVADYGIKLWSSNIK